MEQITVYSLKELKEKFPDGFERAWKDFRNDCANDQLPWEDEIMDSMKKTFKFAGINLEDWSISTCERSYVKFNIPTYWSELADEDILVDSYTGKKALNWLKNAFDLKSAKRVGYIGHDKKKHYRWDCTKLDGKDWWCEFTGYCADQDYLENLLEDVSKNNYDLSEAFHNLADVAAKLFDNEYEYQMSEEYFLDQDYNDNKYTEDGLKI